MFFPRVVGEPIENEDYFPKSTIRRFVEKNRRNPTAAERRLHRILWNARGGALRRRFIFQHAISGRWIVDFFFSEVRLAVEVDGGIHTLDHQRQRDRLKEADCRRFDITLVRVTNSEVFGDRDALLEKLRAGWWAAKRRSNVIIGTTYLSADESARRKQIAQRIVRTRLPGT
jgi:very-short-patch-repair endonuclease